jgi:predicted amidohydrolase
MLLALLQARAVVMDADANQAAIEEAAEAAAAAGAAVLVTPELFAVGYAPLRVREELDVAQLPQLHATFGAIARRHRIGLAYSLPEVTGTGNWHIGATLLDAEGNVLLTYSKVHLFGPDERAAFSPGDGPPPVANFNGIPTSLAICYDVEFPETARAAAVAGAELLLVPTALGHGYDDVPQVLLRARALENQLFIAYANHCGTEEGHLFPGGSVIAGADGRLVAAAGEEPQLLFAEVGKNAAGRHGGVSYLADRRADVYHRWNT